MLDVRNLHVYYGDFLAVKEVDLPIRKNEITALIGPSGCGKSTMLRCFNRMNDLIETARVEGEILYHGVDLYGEGVDAVQVRRHVGMVFQKPNPFPKTIYENIMFGPKVAGFKGDADSLIEESLTRAALWDEVKDKLQESALALSGGQQQRLCIARAIATNPDVVLMDEPCSALDPIATIADRGAHARAQEGLHHHHRHSQHAAGRPGERPDRFLQRRCRRSRRQDRASRRVRPHRSAIHLPVQDRDRGLHHREIWLMADTRARFHDDLAALEELVLDVGDRAERAVAAAVDAFVADDIAAANVVVAMDDEIDRIYLEAHRQWIEIVARQNPMGADLRMLSSLLHLLITLERMGDQAVNIATITKATAGLPRSERIVGQIREMGDQVLPMIRTALQAFVRRDPDEARLLPVHGRADRPAQPQHVPRGGRHRIRPGTARVGDADDDGLACPRKNRRSSG